MSHLSPLSQWIRLPRLGLWVAILIFIVLATAGKPTSWAAPMSNVLNQTVPPPKQLTHLPMIASPLINGCDFYLYACNLTAAHTDATMTYDWSPDGRTIAFYATGAGTSGLYTMDDEGDNRRLLLELSNIDYIRYSPDGSMIALVVARIPEPINDLYLYTLAGGQLRLLSDPASTDFSDVMAVWSPDSSTLLFVRFQHSITAADLYTIRPDGTELTQLTDTPLNEHVPAYSPDGTRIAYAVSDDDPEVTVSISLMQADGSNPVDLTSTIEPFTYNPIWAKDGESIFFFSATENNDWDLYKINADGSDPVNLTHDTLQQSDPALSPDGSQLLFIGRKSQFEMEIDFYTMGIDGSNLTKYPNPHGPEKHPSALKWHPDGKRISFGNFAGAPHIYLLRVGNQQSQGVQ